MDVSWRFEAAPGDDAGKVFRLTWNESGGPRVEPPSHQAFGKRMLERGIARELDGEVRLDDRPDGLVCEMIFPEGEMVSDACC
ncbi:Blue-light-activated histidine kinase [Jannaschia seosinensis]|uniref:Blue-light-activated histidine kinase n=1 Tax=Jannaschia seosinensis TaxID=313367 RepID=A0A0M7B9V0_9RHOB|nr:sensor histidine kinase [Jannaschia seosinensis]CUH26598.1 Blue-light-activated histidine kinase [Jannaschia seosinensis]